MLYGIGLMLLLISASFVGGSVLVPMTIAFIGIVLMSLGRGPGHGKENDTERSRS